MNAVILTSIVLRALGVAYSGLLLYESGDRRFGFLTAMLTLMTARQVLSAQSSTTPIEEFPGLVVSVFAIATVYYLSSYVAHEQRVTDRLRGFRKAVEHAGHAIFLTDTDGTIEYANPAVEDVTGYEPADVVGKDPSLWKSGEHDDQFYADLWEQITSGSVWDGEIINRRKSGDLCWVDMTIAPITDDTGDVERFVAVETDVTDRKERELRIEEQNERLELLNNTNALLREVNRDLVAAESREEVETAVCERFATSDLFDAAWIGERSAVSDEFVARSANGIERATAEQQLDMLAADESSPIRQACEADVPVFLTEGDASRRDSLGGDFVVVPLTYQQANYGVLLVRARRPDTFDAIDRTLVSELGATIADAISGIERKQTLATDNVTELVFRLDGIDDVLVRLSEALACDVTLEHRASNSSNDQVLYCTIEGSTPDEIRSAIDGIDAIHDANHVNTYDDYCLFRLCVDDSSLAPVLADYGASIRNLTATSGSGELTTEVSGSNDVRALVEALTTTYSGVELIARRERERDIETEGEFRTRLEAVLTDRQLEAAQTAHFAGFFEWPRANSGEEVAAMMDISQSTFTQHLRTAERKVFEALFGRTVSN